MSKAGFGPVAKKMAFNTSEIYLKGKLCQVKWSKQFLSEKGTFHSNISLQLEEGIRLI